MAKKWSEVVVSPEFKALSSDDREAARNQYFTDVVAPQVETADLGAARAQFDGDTGQGVFGKAVDAVRDYGLGITSGAAEGVAATEAGLGTFVQAPAANTLSGILNAQALADRGITAALNWASPDSAKTNENIQQRAQDAAQFAAAQRAQAGILNSVGEAMQDDGRSRVKEIQQFNQDYNPELIRQSQAQQDAEGFVDNVSAFVQNPLSSVHTLARSAPDMAVGLGVARGVAGGLAAAGRSTAAQVGGASTAGILAESASSANQSRESTYQAVKATPQAVLNTSRRYNEIRAQGHDPATATEILANELADQTPLLAAAGTAAGSVLVNRAFGGDTTAKMLAGQRTTLKDIPKQFLHEGTEETLQGTPEELTQHGAIVQADKNRELDLAGAAGQNFMAGAAMGGGGTLAAHTAQSYKDFKTGRGATGGADATGSGGATGSTDGTPPGYVDAADVLGTPAAGSETGTTGAVQQGAQPSESDKALYTPKNLTALDRVTEIDKELTKPDVPADKATELKAERDSITATWPKAVMGNETEVILPSGAAVKARWAVVDASEPTPSHDIYGKPNQSYDKTLQPRDRGDRFMYEAQMSKMSTGFNPVLVDESPLAGMGAPTMRADGSMIDGNGRESAIQRVYAAMGQKADELRAYVPANSARKGIAPESIAHIPNPQFIRIIDHSQGIDYNEFAKQANESVMMKMSSGEQAKADAARMDNLEDLSPDDNGDFVSSKSSPFVRSFLAKLPGTEQAGMIDANGALSQAGYGRIRNAVLAKAYGDSPVLLRMTESLDDNLRNISKALMKVAPDVAKTRQAISEGALHDADVTPHLMAAVEEISKIKESGRAVSEMLAQTDVFGDKLDPETREILSFLDENMRRPRVIADFIRSGMDALVAAGNPQQGSLLGESKAPAKRDLIEAARRATNGDNITEDTSGQQPAGPQGVSGQVAGEPADAPRFSRSGQGNEGSGQASDEVAAIAESYAKFPDKDPSGVDDAQWESFVTGREASRKAVIAKLTPKAEGLIVPAGYGYQMVSKDTRPDGSEWRVTRFDKDMRPTGHEAYDTPAEAVASVVSGYRPTEAPKPQASSTKSEWVNFPKDTGTLGIPRAEMPQVKGEHRGALIQFLAGRGVSHETLEIPSSEIKPTQAEFAPKKAEGWKDVLEGSERSVLISSDNHILDGHHQWVAALSQGEPIKAIKLDAPIRELLPLVHQFPSVQKSTGATKSPAAKTSRAQADEDFKNALADMGAFLRQVNPGLRMLTAEEKTKLMPTLVKLFEAGIRQGIFKTKDLVAHVKAAMKVHADEFVRKHWNKVDSAAYDDAARRALDRSEKGVNANNYDNGIDNFAPPAVKDFLPADAVAKADGLVEKYYKNKSSPDISAEDRAKAEAMLAPLLKKASADKVAFDQKVIDIAKNAKALGQMLAPIKGVKRAAEKLVLENQFNMEKMVDTLRSTIVVSSYDDVQAVLDAIAKEFPDIPRLPKNRTGGTNLSMLGASLPGEDLGKSGNYRDVLVNVRMPSGVVAEIQINTPEMIAAKEGPNREGQGHKLYEAYRDAPKDSPLGQEINEAMKSFYDAAFAASLAAAKSRQPLAYAKKAASDDGSNDLGWGSPAGKSSAPSSESPKTLPSGKTTLSSPPSESKNSQPAGNLSGTRINSTSKQSISNGDLFGYTNNEDSSRGVVNGQDGNDGADGTQGTEPGAAGATDGKQGTDKVSGGPSSGNNGSDRNADGTTGGAAGPRKGGKPSRSGGNNENGGTAGNGNRAKRNAAIPAGRDIPPKSGRNYVFGDNDLTYAGSWFVKAKQNVEAVELLKKLETEGRQATRDEQATLAKFVGWGSSEIANSLFGDKLDKQLAAIKNYDTAIESMADYARDYLYQGNRGYYQAFEVLAAKDPAKYSQRTYYQLDRITKDMLTKAKPDTSAKKWAELRDRLEAVLSKEDMEAASRSTQYAHYTSKSVVKALLGAVEKMGFKGGTILEPGAGIGVFPGLMNSDMAANSVYTGVEFEPVTGGILKQLFPDERILVESFVDSKLPENFYDVAFGNPPFGALKILGDPKYVKHAFALHDYFFAKSIDSVKPGGLLVFVTSRYTMDKQGDKARAFMAERADLVGAIRLPQTAFKQNAGTDVVTDVLFLRKKVPGETFTQGHAWGGLGEVTTPEGKFLANEYFVSHPDMVLGDHSGKGKMQNAVGPQYTVLPHAGDIEAQFVKATENLPADVFVAGRGSAAEAAAVRTMDFDPKAKKEGSFYVSDAGILMQREGGVGMRADEKHQKNAALLKSYVGLRDAIKQAQLDQLNDGDWESSLKALHKSYTAFVKQHGRINQFTSYMQNVKVDELDEEGVPTGNKVADTEERRRFPVLSALKDDPEWTLAANLENFNEETGAIADSKWLTERTLGKPAVAEIKTPADALLATLDDSGTVDIAAIADRIGLTEQETIDSLGNLIYDDPAQGWVMADEYLSGNVKKKLAQAEEAAKSNKAMVRNVEALREVLPTDRIPDQITPQIGMNWIPGEIYAKFLHELTGVKAKIEYVKRTREWVLTTQSGEGTPRATVDWGVGDKAHAGWLMEKALSGAPISLNKSVSDGKGGSKQVFDADRSEAANEKRQELKQEFRKWLFQDAERTEQMTAIYNDKFNTTVQRKFDGRHLSLPGTSKLFNIFPHVKRGAWRVIQTGNTYLAHAVGSGKTFEMVISAMEQKRLGKIKKPMVIVPGHMLQQFATEWQQLYPTARLMVADETDFHTDNRRRFVSRVAMSDLDGVIMTHSSFKLLDLDPVFKEKMIEQELAVMRASYEEAGGDLDDIGDKKVRKDPKIKRIEAQIERLEQQLLQASSSSGKDKNVRFDEMGVDMLYVDEAHLFRKLSYATARQIKGIDPAGSQMAWDLYMKTRWLKEKNPSRYLVMASGTPITNTTAELYTVQRYMAPDVLVENGLDGFDDWASQFGSERTTIEATASGKYEQVTRFQDFVNVGEMTQMFRDFADVLTEDQLAELLGDKRPKVVGGARKMVITPKTEDYKEFLANVLTRRIDASKRWKPSFEQQFNPDPIININTDARLAAIDMRFMDPSLPSDPQSKLNQMIDGVVRVYKETKDNEYRGKSTKDKDGNEVLADFEPIKGATQMVFFESGFGKMVAERRGFSARAWMEKRLRDAGIPPNQVAFMEDYKKSSAKLKLFSDVNKGKVRVLVGSSAAMGTGVNAQQRLVALHHLDAPYVPATLEQREGRIIRQGNKNPLVQIYAYAMFGSFDENQWAMLARKKFFVEQALSGDPNLRTIEDVGEVNQMQLAAGLVAENPFVMQHAGAKSEVDKLMRLYRNHEDQLSRLQADYSNAGHTIAFNQTWLPQEEAAAARVKDLSGDKFTGKAGGKDYVTRKEWGTALLAQFKELSDKLTTGSKKVGELSGFDVNFAGLMPQTTVQTYEAALRLDTPIPAVLARDALADPGGLAIRAVNALVDVERKPVEMRRIIKEAEDKRAALATRLDAPFPLGKQLASKTKEMYELEAKMLTYGTAPAQTPQSANPVATDFSEANQEVRFSRSGVQSANGLPDTPVDRVIDADTLRGLRNEAAGLERPKDGVFLSVTEDGRAVAVGPKGTRVPETFTRFAQKHGLSFEARRRQHSGHAMVHIDTKTSPMPARYRESGAMYFGEMGNFADRTGLTRFLRGGTGFDGGVSVRSVEHLAKQLLEGLKNPPKLVVVWSPKDLSAFGIDAPSDARGSYYKGTIYLVAGGISSREELREVVAHEMMGHYGLRGFFGDALDAELFKIHAANPRVQKLAAKWTANNQDVIAEYIKDGATDAKVRAIAIEEGLVKIVENGETITGWKTLVAGIQKLLRAAGLNGLADTLESKTDAEALLALKKAAVFVRDGLTKNSKASALYPAFLRQQKLSDDLAAQQKWLDVEARARGFKDIDELATKAYPVFEKLAELWREKHPVREALFSRSRYLPKVSPQSQLDADIKAATAALTKAINGIKRSGSIQGAPIRIGRLPHVLSMLGKPNQDLEIFPSIIHKIFIDPEKHASEFKNVTPEQFVRAIYRPALVTKGQSEKEVDVVTDIVGSKGVVTVPIIIGDIRGNNASAVMSAYQRKVSHDKAKENADTIMRRVDTPGRLLYVDLGKSKVALTGRQNNEARAGGLQGAGGSSVTLNIADHDVPTTQATTTTEPIIQNTYAPVNENFIGWRDVSQKLHTMIANKQVKTEMDLLRWIGDNYNPESSSKGWGDVPAFSRSAASSPALPPSPPTPKSTAVALRKQWIKQADRVIDRMDAAINGLGELPDKAQYLAQRYLALGKISRVDEIAGNIRKVFKAATKDDKKAVYDYLTTRGANPATIKDTSVRDWAEKTKAYIGTVGDELVKRGLIPQASREEYRDRYLPRLYLAHLLDDGSWRDIGGGKKTSDMGYLKQRNESLSDEYMNVILGKVSDPAFLAASAIAQPMRDMAILDWLQQISVNTNWVWPEQLIDWNGRQVSAHWLQAESDALLERAALYDKAEDRKKAEAIATAMRQKALATLADMPREHKDYKRIPDSPRYGQLRGLLVRKDIYNDLVGLGSGVPGDAGWAENLLGQGGLGTKATQLWKTAKVALNPPGQIRNFISNVVMLQLSGAPLHKIPSLLVRAIRQTQNNGIHWQAAKKYGVTAATFTAQELYRSKRDVLELEREMNGNNPLLAIRMAANFVMDKAGDAYQWSEAIVKTAKMIDAMEREGMTADQAALEAQKWLFDYSLVNQNIRYLRNAPVGMPFLTYSTKVAPRLMEVAAKHPQRFLPWAMLFYGMGYAAMAALGGGDDDWKQLKEALPEWLRKKPHAVPLPWRDSEGRIQFTDIGYFFPWSQWAQVGNDLSGGEVMGALGSAGIIGGPVPDVIAAIKTNIDPFTKREIVDPADPPMEKSIALMNYVWSMAAPPFMTSNGFLSPMGVFDKKYGGKLVQGTTGTTDKYGEERATTPQAFASLVGVNLKGVNPDVTRAAELLRMSRATTDVQIKLRQELQDQSLTEDQRKAKMASYFAEITKRNAKTQEYSEKSAVPEFARPTR